MFPYLKPIHTAYILEYLSPNLRYLKCLVELFDEPTSLWREVLQPLTQEMRWRVTYSGNCAKGVDGDTQVVVVVVKHTVGREAVTWSIILFGKSVVIISS